MSGERSNWPYLLAAIALAVPGGFLGMVTALDDATYLRLLAVWAALTALATILFGVVMRRGGPARLIATVLLGVTWAFGVDPAIRLFHLLAARI